MPYQPGTKSLYQTQGPKIGTRTSELDHWAALISLEVHISENHLGLETDHRAVRDSDRFDCLVVSLVLGGKMSFRTTMKRGFLAVECVSQRVEWKEVERSPKLRWYVGRAKVLIAERSRGGVCGKSSHLPDSPHDASPTPRSRAEEMTLDAGCRTFIRNATQRALAKEHPSHEPFILHCGYDPPTFLPTSKVSRECRV